MAIGPFNFTNSSLITDANLALNLLSGAPNTDVVGVFDQTSFTQLFINARPMKAFIREISRVMEHPLETGAMVADHMIIDPTTIDLLIIVAAPDFSGAFQQIRSAWQAGTLLIVQTKSCVYKNMIIQNLPREEDPERFNITTINLQLKEVLFATQNGTTATSSVSYYSPANPSDQTQVLRGIQSAITAASSLLSGIHAASTWGFIK